MAFYCNCVSINTHIILLAPPPPPPFSSHYLSTLCKHFFLTCQRWCIYFISSFEYYFWNQCIQFTKCFIYRKRCTEMCCFHLLTWVMILIFNLKLDIHTIPRHLVYRCAISWFLLGKISKCSKANLSVIARVDIMICPLLPLSFLPVKYHPIDCINMYMNNCLKLSLLCYYLFLSATVDSLF